MDELGGTEAVNSPAGNSFGSISADSSLPVAGRGLGEGTSALSEGETSQQHFLESSPWQQEQESCCSLWFRHCVIRDQALACWPQKETKTKVKAMTKREITDGFPTD